MKLKNKLQENDAQLQEKLDTNPLGIIDRRKQSLLNCLNSVLNNPKFHDEIYKVANKLKISYKDIAQSYLDYNFDVRNFGNEIYESLSIHLTMHVLNLLEKSWHQDRQNTVLEYLLLSKAQSVIDIGFGIPSLYVRQALAHRTLKITLSDYSEAAFTFAKVLLEEWDPAWTEVVSFKKSNMEEQEYIGSFDLYVFQDSIEHTTDPTGYLSKQVQLSAPSAQFLIGLPIGPIIPSHFMAWDSTSAAIEWLKSCGLKIKTSKLISVNPNVDLFAEPLGNNLKNFFVLCDKI